MRLTAKVRTLLELLKAEGCSVKVVESMEEIIRDVENYEKQLLALANDNIMLTDTLQADRSLHAAELLFERHLKKQKPDQH